jgi:hypothetical protein
MAENEVENTTETGKNKEIIETMRARWKTCLEADEEQRRDGMEDMKFTVVPGYQWDENQKKERGLRPCYEFNKVRVTAKRVINNMRINRPMGKVRGTEDSDKDTAEVYEGLIRNIWARSKGDSVIDYAAEYQVVAGYGAWRLDTDFTADDVFEQDISIKPIANPFCLFPDPSDQDPLKRNARYWILTDRMTTDEFNEMYKGKEVIDFPSHEFDDEEDWESEDDVRIAEYWYKEPYTKEIWQLQDGRVVDASDEIPEELVVKRRTVDTHKIMMCIASGSAILEGPTEWAGSMFPFVPVYGEYYIIDGKTYWNGITRFAKDPQRSYNVSRTSLTETIAQAPQAKWWATAGQAEGHTDAWKEAHIKNYPFLVYNPDPQAPGAPQRMGTAEVPIALIQESQMAAEEINMVTGVYQNDIGAPNAATSGVQERERNYNGQISTFNYQDNQAAAIERTWELFVDLIPKVYDTERSLRILGQDDREDYVRINTAGVDENGKPIPANDLAMGKYDVTITVGPSFTTKRQEAAETYQTMLQGSPDMFPIIGDLVFKSLDLPYSEEIAERIKVMAPPQIQQLLNQDQQIPPEVQAMMQQAQMAMQQVEEQMRVVQEEAAKADIDKAEVEKLIANLETDQAQFEAKVEKEVAKLAKIEAGIVKKDAQATIKEIQAGNTEEIDNTRMEVSAQLAEQMAQAILAIQEVAAQFTGQAVATIDKIQDAAEHRPKIKQIEQQRVNGKLVAVPVYED